MRARGAELLAISADSPFSHAAFAKARGFSFPLLSDIHRSVIRAYGMLDEERNVAYRATVVIDREGTVRWSQAGDRHMIRDGREVARVLELVESLRQKGVV